MAQRSEAATEVHHVPQMMRWEEQGERSKEQAKLNAFQKLARRKTTCSGIVNGWARIPKSCL